VRVSVDTLPPFLDITYPAQELLVNTTSVEVTGRTEPGCTVRIDGEPVPFYLGQFSAEVNLQEGTNEILVMARDPAGNINSSLVRVTRDTIAPGLTVSVPREGAVIGERVLAVSGTVEEGARVLVDGREAAVSGPFFSANVTLVEGANLITVLAQDPAGNVATVVLRVTVDTSPQFISVDLENGTITRNAYLLLTGETKNGSALSVNGVAAAVGPDGRFLINISLQTGLNAIHLVARGPLGDTTSLDRTVTREGTTAPPKPADRQPARNGNTPAVLIAAAIAIAVVLALALFFRRPPEPLPGTAAQDGPGQKGSGA
jgi:hypothetical protein